MSLVTNQFRCSKCQGVTTILRGAAHKVPREAAANLLRQLWEHVQLGTIPSDSILLTAYGTHDNLARVFRDPSLDLEDQQTILWEKFDEITSKMLEHPLTSYSVKLALEKMEVSVPAGGGEIEGRLSRLEDAAYVMCILGLKPTWELIPIMKQCIAMIHFARTHIKEAFAGWWRTMPKKCFQRRVRTLVQCLSSELHPNGDLTSFCRIAHLLCDAYEMGLRRPRALQMKTLEFFNSDDVAQMDIVTLFANFKLYNELLHINPAGIVNQDSISKHMLEQMSLNFQTIARFTEKSVRRNILLMFDLPFVMSSEVRCRLVRQFCDTLGDACAQEAIYGDYVDEGRSLLDVRVRRHALLEDTILFLSREVKRHNPENSRAFHRLLVVHFVGEQGNDAGGLRNEWLRLACDGFLDPQFGLFENVSESRLNWFNLSHGDEVRRYLYDKYQLFGVLLGLGVFYGVPLSLKFPVLFYKALLTSMCAPLYARADESEDIEELCPDMVRGFHQILEFDPSMVQDVFCLSFTTTTGKELRPGGRHIDVTGANRVEYVQQYTEHLRRTSIATIMTYILDGFEMVIHQGSPLRLFFAHELRTLFEGHALTDEELLRLRTMSFCEAPLSDNHPSYCLFWTWLMRTKKKETRQKALRFFTGFERVPPASSDFRLHFFFDHAGVDRLPRAQTCSNAIYLSAFSSEPRFLKCMKFALDNCCDFQLS